MCDFSTCASCCEVRFLEVRFGVLVVHSTRREFRDRKWRMLVPCDFGWDPTVRSGKKKMDGKQAANWKTWPWPMGNLSTFWRMMKFSGKIQVFQPLWNRVHWLSEKIFGCLGAYKNQRYPLVKVTSKGPGKWTKI